MTGKVLRRKQIAERHVHGRPLRMMASSRAAMHRLVAVGSRRLCSSAPLISVHEVAGAPKAREVRLQKAPVNTFDVRMLELFTSTIKSLEADPAVEGMILTSAFPKVFSAGLDIPALVNPTEEEFRHFWSTFEGLVSTYYMTPLHSVAAIAGNTPALGAVLSICSDYRVMADDDKAKFGLNETSLGMVPPRWLAGMTARTIGERNAELHLGGSSMLSPREALQCGFLDEVCTREELMARAVAASVKACRIPLGARSAYKQMVRKPVADMCGPASVDEMSACILGAEFQATASAIMEALRQRSKKK